MSFIRPIVNFPSVLASNLVADNETEGVNSRVLTLPSASGGLLLGWVCLRTAIYAGPLAGNNGNTYSLQVTQDYGPVFTQYTLRGYVSSGASGGANQTQTVTKSSGDTEELTLVGLLINRGGVVDSSVVNRVASGAGATHTSGSVTATGPALLVAAGSGTGDINPTAPTQTWPGDWTILQSVARNSSQAPNGHVPFYLAIKTVGAGSHTVNIQTTIDEGIVISLYAIQ